MVFPISSQASMSSFSVREDIHDIIAALKKLRSDPEDAEGTNPLIECKGPESTGALLERSGRDHQQHLVLFTMMDDES